MITFQDDSLTTEKLSNIMSTDLWRTWVEEVTQPSCTRGRGFRVVRRNEDGVAAGQPVSARRCFPLLRVWRQRRSITLCKIYTACVRKSSLKVLQVLLFIRTCYIWVGFLRFQLCTFFFYSVWSNLSKTKISKIVKLTPEVGANCLAKCCIFAV